MLQLPIKTLNVNEVQQLPYFLETRKHNDTTNGFEHESTKLRIDRGRISSRRHQFPATLATLKTKIPDLPLFHEVTTFRVEYHKH